MPIATTTMGANFDTYQLQRQIYFERPRETEYDLYDGAESLTGIKFVFSQFYDFDALCKPQNNNQREMGRELKKTRFSIVDAPIAKVISKW